MNKILRSCNHALNFSITLIILQLLFFSSVVSAQETNPYPYATNDVSLTIWNETEYIPFFIKGVNLGVSVPGTFPGQLAATTENYDLWFNQIKEAGFNCIRLYTLHYPRFYEALEAYNLANSQNPLLFIQGVWLEEEIPAYNHDLYSMTTIFTQEIEDDIDCVHGNNIIPTRLGKAYGTYSTDVSKWCLAYIIGREVYPNEVLTTDTLNSGVTQFTGTHFSIINASASEVWVTNMLDHTVNYEHVNYSTQRPVSCSSWPTLDPIAHIEEPNVDEDLVQIDLSKIDILDAPAGLFISYHAYPYYPDFVSEQSSYQSYSDDYGPNSYLGYLNELKSHYMNTPLIIAEYGVPSSWAIAHYASSGMNHGGFDEYNQGQTNIRMLGNMRSANCGGGIQFSWIDEWFKRTWVTDPVDYIADSRILWHNVAAAEQNYGLISFDNISDPEQLILFDANSKIQYINAEANFGFFEMEIGLKDLLGLSDEIWVALDTYDETLGESILPNGESIPSRSEFAIKITNYSAQLYVTQAYDIFGIWHNISGPDQLFHSIPTDGAPWEIVRIKNNSSESDVQYTGNLQVNHDFQPPSSKDAVMIYDDKIHIRIPWSYLNVVAPDQKKVLNDDRNTPEKEDVISDGFAISVNYENQWYNTNSRYQWTNWTNVVNNTVERLKTSYYVMKDQLPLFNSAAIAVKDEYAFTGPDFPVSITETEGLLKNDFDIDGNTMVSLIVENPLNGQVFLNNNGSFTYSPNPNFTGYETFKYSVYDGQTLSKPNTVTLFVEKNNTGVEITPDNIITLYPVPVNEVLNIESPLTLDEIQIFDKKGKMVTQHFINAKKYTLNISNFSSGSYILITKVGNKILSDKFIKN